MFDKLCLGITGNRFADDAELATFIKNHIGQWLMGLIRFQQFLSLCQQVDRTADSGVVRATVVEVAEVKTRNVEGCIGIDF